MSDALKVACGKCGAPVGQNCDWKNLLGMGSTFHLRRMVAANKLPPQPESLFPPMGDRSLHFEDDAVIAAMDGSEYLINNVRQRLGLMTTGEKWSLYRAVVKLAEMRGEPRKENDAKENALSAVPLEGRDNVSGIVLRDVASVVPELRQNVVGAGLESTTAEAEDGSHAR